MAKRRREDSADRFVEDDPIGLTSAFEVIRDPQAVEYDTGDDAIGLTEAFGAVAGDEDVVHSWDKAGKWTDFDWDAAPPDEGVLSDGEAAASGETDAEPADGAIAETEPAEPAEAVSAVREQPAPSQTGSIPAVSAQGTSSGGGRGRHAAPIPELSPRMKQSKRTRRTLIFIIILLVVILGVLGYFGYRAFDDSQHEAAQQAQEQTAAPKESIGETTGKENGDTPVRMTEVPELTGLFGKNTDQAIEAIGHGAIVTSNQKVKEKGSAIKTEVSVALTEEPADSKTGTPTVYLGLDKNKKIIQIGYSASASALGFGSFSFADAINEKHVVEETFKLMGVDLPEGAVKLPKNKDKYSTYGSDGTTVVKERYSFDGTVDVNGSPYAWSSVLSYDYTTQVLTGNLSDTVRVIYAYLTQG